jgi:tetratricopeptide (TPR) repeat protein
VADIYHKEKNYRLAASFYHRAAEAAEEAELPELRVDALILSGAALAELGEAKEAREQLDDALRLARDAGYSSGEENALVQIELLEADAGEGES